MPTIVRWLGNGTGNVMHCGSGHTFQIARRKITDAVIKSPVLP